MVGDISSATRTEVLGAIRQRLRCGRRKREQNEINGQAAICSQNFPRHILFEQLT